MPDSLVPGIARLEPPVAVPARDQPRAALDAARRVGWLLPPFLLSGAAALTYQVCWQRLLFVSFGVDIETVTIIVSSFMLGLGAGALLGGELAERRPGKALVLFGVIEGLIGIFGVLSPSLIHLVAERTVRAPLPVIASVNFLLILVPTTLMGATLPLLTAHVLQRYGSVGVSIGSLYCVNTLGAALGAALTSFVAWDFMGITATIRLAAGTNLFVAVSALLLASSARR